MPSPKAVGEGQQRISLLYRTRSQLYVMIQSLILIQGKPWKNEWVDLVRFNSQGKITQMKEFFDTGHVHSHLEELESESKNTK